MTTSVPSQFGKYTQIIKIGEGGFGEVYRAVDTKLGRSVALKVPHRELPIDKDTAFVTQFRQEAQLAAQLDHPNIVRIYSIGDLPDGTPYIEMELVDGQSLADLIKEKRRLTPQEALIVIEGVCAALQEAHGKGIVHRDLKPQNILIRKSDGRVLVTDFGLAKATESSFQASLSSSNVVVGTFRYMPPEQANRRLGEIGPASDLYGLGCVLYEMLTGRPPFENNSVGQLVHEHTSEPPEPPSNINISLTRAVESVVLKALQKKPEDRFSSAKEMSQALADAVKHGKIVPGIYPEKRLVGASNNGSAISSRSHKWRRWLPWGLLAIATLIIVVLILVNVIVPVPVPVIDPTVPDPATPIPHPTLTSTPSQAPTDTPLPTATSTPTITPSATWTSTPTQTLTPTVTPTTTPVIASLFDDFSLLDTKTWTRVAGAWRSDGQELALQNEDSVGLLVAGHHDWNDYEVRVGLRDLTDYPDDKSFGPAPIIPLARRQSCSFPSPSSKEGYDASFMNGTAVRRTDDDGDPIDWCAPGIWNNRVAIVVGIDPTGPSSGLIVGENWIGWGQLVGTDWSIVSTDQLVPGIGSVVGDLRIQVRDKSYQVFLNGEQLPLDFSDQGKPGGKIGLWARSATSTGNGLYQEGDPLTPAFDYLEVTPLDPQPVSRSETITQTLFAAETPAPTMDLTPIRRANDTPTRRSANTATPRSTNTPTRQATPRPTPTPCTVALHRDFQAVWTKAGGASAGCPIGSAYQRRVAYQPFQDGFMLWRAGSANRDTGGMLYVAYNSPRKWQEYYDAWVDGMPEQAGYTPPAPGLREPRRGFGYLWRTTLGGPSSDLGWAVGDEQGSDFGLIQDFANGAAIIRFPQQAPVFFPDRLYWVS